jgi:hypothetical protein
MYRSYKYWHSGESTKLALLGLFDTANLCSHIEISLPNGDAHLQKKFSNELLTLEKTHIYVTTFQFHN